MISAALPIVLALAAAGDLPPAPTPTDTPAPPVAIRQPPAGDAVLDQATTRIRSELAASGIASTEVDCLPGGAADGAGCSADAAGATISLAREDGVVEIDVRLVLPDGLELRRHVRVIARDGGDDPSVLAVRAVELLRDLRLTARPRAPAGPQGPARDDEEPHLPVPPPPPPPWRLSFGFGGLTAVGFNEPVGMPLTVGPVITAGRMVAPNVFVLANLAGPFNTSLSVPSPGTAQLVQALAWVEVRYQFLLEWAQPFVAVSTGVNYLHATLTNTDTGTSVTSAWVPLLGVGLGSVREFRKGLFVSLQVDVFISGPPQVVDFDNQVVGETGGPSILVSAGFGSKL